MGQLGETLAALQASMMQHAAGFLSISIATAVAHRVYVPPTHTRHETTLHELCGNEMRADAACGIISAGNTAACETENALLEKCSHSWCSQLMQVPDAV